MITSSTTYKLFLLTATLFAISLLPGSYAFGAGDIPDFAYLQDKAFRHGDIENILEYIVRWGGKTDHGGGLMGIATGLLAAASGGAKFSKADVNRVYYGNWLRDYSQAMDVAGLSKVTADTIVLALSFLSFLTFGYGTEEFQLTADRLGCYLPVEHMDNPKGYADQAEPPNKYHPKLRGKMENVEIEIDNGTGMKNYIAREGQPYDTSAAFIRRSFQHAIELGRKSGGKDCPDLFEAYRLLGQGLHTLEDLLAHSNWVEISFLKAGHNDVFCHVGDGVRVEAPNGGGKVPPLVTGTFGGADFMFSVMGEAADKLSQTSLADVSGKLDDAKSKESPIDPISILKQILRMTNKGGDGDQKADQSAQKADELKKNAVNFNPDDYTTEQVQKQLWDALVWRDGVMRQVDRLIEGIPGLQELVDQLFEALAVYVCAVMEPFMKPILKQVTDAISDGSQMVIARDDQFQVFDNANASDPSHSMLSKDHFDNLLNEPAGKIAKVVVERTVTLIVGAWSDGSKDINNTLNEILQAIHHPYWAKDDSIVQTGMRQTFEKWLNGLDRNDQQTVLERLTKEAVKNGENKRLGADDNTVVHSHASGLSTRRGGGAGGGGAGASHSSHTTTSGGGYGQQPQRQQQTYGASGGGYGGQQQSTGGGYGGEQRYGEQQERQHQTSGGYGGQQQTTGYGDEERHSGYGRQQQDRQHQTSGGYGAQQETTGGGYGGEQRYGQQQERQHQTSGGYGGEERYGQQKTSGGYGGHQQTTGGGYGGTQRSSGYDEQQAGSGYGQQEHSRPAERQGERNPYADQAEEVAGHLAENLKNMDLGKRFGL